MALRLQKRDAFFIVVIVVVIAGLIALSRTGRHPKPVSPACNIAKEKPDTSVKDRRASCLSCHDPKTGAIEAQRLKPNHPQKWMDEKFPCTGCHNLPPKPQTPVPGLTLPAARR